MQVVVWAQSTSKGFLYSISLCLPNSYYTNYWVSVTARFLIQNLAKMDHLFWGHLSRDHIETLFVCSSVRLSVHSSIHFSGFFSNCPYKMGRDVRPSIRLLTLHFLGLSRISRRDNLKAELFRFFISGQFTRISSKVRVSNCCSAFNIEPMDSKFHKQIVVAPLISNLWIRNFIRKY